MRLSARDMGFLIETDSPEVRDKSRLNLIIEKDEYKSSVFIKG